MGQLCEHSPARFASHTWVTIALNHTVIITQWTLRRPLKRFDCFHTWRRNVFVASQASVETFLRRGGGHSLWNSVRSLPMWANAQNSFVQVMTVLNFTVTKPHQKHKTRTNCTRGCCEPSLGEHTETPLHLKNNAGQSLKHKFRCWSYFDFWHRNFGSRNFYFDIKVEFRQLARNTKFRISIPVKESSNGRTDGTDNLNSKESSNGRFEWTTCLARSQGTTIWIETHDRLALW